MSGITAYDIFGTNDSFEVENSFKNASTALANNT